MKQKSLDSLKGNIFIARAGNSILCQFLYTWGWELYYILLYKQSNYL